MKKYLVKTLCGLISVPSVSGHEERLSRKIYSELKKSGINVKMDADGNVTAKTGKGRKRLVFNGHIDTVPAEAWEFNPRVSGNRIYGRGASDMKSGLAVMMYLAQNVSAGIETYYTFTVCEERRDLKRNGSEIFSKKVRADYVVSLEPTVDKKLDICLASQGRMTAHIEVRGKASHSSTPGLGENAISRAANIVQRVDRLNSGFKPYKIYANCSGKPAASVTEIKAGIATNIIPDSCKMVVDRRMGIYEPKSRFTREMHSLLNNIPYNKLVISDDHPKGVTDTSGRLFKSLKESYTEALGYAPGYIVIYGAYDTGFFYERGMDVIGIGPGLKNQCHVKDEYCQISDMVDCTEVLKKLIYKLADNKR